MTTLEWAIFILGPALAALLSLMPMLYKKPMEPISSDITEGES